MEKKILVFGYYRANLGDDLFLYILSQKYKNIKFYVHIKEDRYKKAFKNLNNVICLEEERDVDSVKIEDFDSYIYIGGSIFIESKYSKGELSEFTKFAKKCKENSKPLIYMTCNFGPYSTNEYVENSRKLFEFLDGICFRDKDSYEIFSDIPSVSYAPDIVLAYDFSKLKQRKKIMSIGISVVDLEIRDKLKNKEEVYNDYIKRIIIKFAKRGYKVNLISFCADELDEKTVEKIKKVLPEKYKNKVGTIKYSGDIEEFIKQYSEMRYMVCTRFHSMILSMIFRQKMYHLAYSKKTNNFLQDLGENYKIDNIENLEYDTCLRITDFKKIDEKKLKELKIEAQGQFKSLDNWIHNNS